VGFARNLRKHIGLKLFCRRKKINKVLDMSNVNSILFIRYDDKIGDVVCATMLFREIKKAYPKIKIALMCGKKSEPIVKFNPFVDEILNYSKRFYKDVFVVIKNRHKFDLAFDFDISIPKFLQLLLLRVLLPSFLIGLNKKQINIYDLSIDITDTQKLGEHITFRHKLFLKTLGIANVQNKYDIFIPDEIQNEATDLFSKAKEKIKVILNPFADSSDRCFLIEDIKNLIENLKKFNTQIYILCHGNHYKRIKNLLHCTYHVASVLSKSILNSAALIKFCDIVITPDTSIAHIASAFEKKAIVVYINNGSRILWSPNNANATAVYAETMKDVDVDLITEKFKEEFILG
jgi:ADP-heptose:LPS heptosyltransferase